MNNHLFGLFRLPRLTLTIDLYVKEKIKKAAHATPTLMRFFFDFLPPHGNHIAAALQDSYKEVAFASAPTTIATMWKTFLGKLAFN